MGHTLSLRYLVAITTAALAAPMAHADLESMGDQELRAITGGTALQYSATDISYDLSQLTGVEYAPADCTGLLGCVVDGLTGNTYSRSERRTVTEHVDATVHRLQINGSGELHAYMEEFTLGDYGGTNNSIYKVDGQGIPENALRNFGFGNSAEDPFYFEDPYIEIQKQHHADGSETIRAIRIGFGKAEGHVPVTIDSASGYISTVSLLPELSGIIKAQVYGTGTKDTFVSVGGDIPDGTGNYPVFGPDGSPKPAGAPNNTSGPLDATAGVVDGVTGILDPITEPLNIDTDIQAPGGKELNLEHVVSLDFKNVQNFYISLTQGGGNSFVNDDGSVNGALWSQHLNGIIPKTRADLPGFNQVMPFNDPSNPSAGHVEAHTNTQAALTQILLGVGDNNPRQSYDPVF